MARPVAYVLRRFPVLSETFVLDEILALEDLGLDMCVFALAPPRDERYHAGIARIRAPIYYVPGVLEPRRLLEAHRRLFAMQRRRYLSEVLRALRTLRPEAVWRFVQAGYIADKARSRRVRHLHAHFATYATTVAQMAGGLLDAPTSFTAHAYDIYQDVDRRDIRRKMARAKHVVTVADVNVDYLAAIDPGSADKITRVYNGVDLDLFVPHAPATEVFTVLTVARLVEKKGLEVLLEACRLLRDQGIQMRCRIVGKGAERQALEAFVREHDLGERVAFLGALSHEEVRQQYREAHVFALPCVVTKDGNRDGLPVSIVEALACGLPVISTPVSGIPEAVSHDVNGLLVRAGDAVGLAEALGRLAQEPETRQRLAAAARPSIVARFDRRQTSAQLYRLLQGESAR